MPPPEKRNDKNVDAAWETVGQPPPMDYGAYSPEALAGLGARGAGRPNVNLLQIRDAINLLLEANPRLADPAEYEAEMAQTEGEETLGAVEAAYDSPDQSEINQLQDPATLWPREQLPQWMQDTGLVERRDPQWEPTPRSHYEEPGLGWVYESGKPPKEPPPTKEKRPPKGESVEQARRRQWEEKLENIPNGSEVKANDAEDIRFILEMLGSGRAGVGR